MSGLFCLGAFATTLLLQSGPAFCDESSQSAPRAESETAPEDYFTDLIVEDADRNSRTDRNKFSVIRLAGGNSLVRFTIRDKVYEELRNEAGMTMHTRIVDRASRELLQIRISDRFHDNGETARMIVHDFAKSGAVSSEVTTFTAEGDAVHRASIHSATGRWSKFKWDPEAIEFKPVSGTGVDPKDPPKFVWDHDRLKWKRVD